MSYGENETKTSPAPQLILKRINDTIVSLILHDRNQKYPEASFSAACAFRAYISFLMDLKMSKRDTKMVVRELPKLIEKARKGGYHQYASELNDIILELTGKNSIRLRNKW
jgi:hypothetical protein